MDDFIWSSPSIVQLVYSELEKNFFFMYFSFYDLF